MPTRRIDTKESCWDNRKVCRHPEHNPPSMRVFEPGLYEHECPACGHTQVFKVDGKYLVSLREPDASRTPQANDTSDDWVKWEPSR